MIIKRPTTMLAVALASTLLAGACQSAAPSPAASPRASPIASPGAPTAAPSPTSFDTPSLPPASTAPRLGAIAVSLQPFARVPGGPIAIAAPDDGTGRLFVAAQDGKIWVVRQDGTVLPKPMLDIGGLVSTGSEQGLLGLATHPSFPIDARVFINYTDVDGDSIVASASLDPDDPGRLDPGTLTKLLVVEQPYANHNGGSVVFGPDAKLYLSFGDGGSGGDPRGYGQRLDTLLGKILRVDIDGDPSVGPYVVPPDNPYANGGGLPEIWHWGLRNPWRTSFDRATGDLWIGDVGQGSWEEVDVARQGTSNVNFGWNVMEGSHCFDKPTCRKVGLTLPVSDYGRDLGCTVIGGYVYRGAAYPFLVGAYLFADYCSGRIFALDAASNDLAPPVVVGEGPSGAISAFGEDVDGELYVVSLGGDISRVVATDRQATQ